jgi:uncharacterized protein YceK
VPLNGKSLSLRGNCLRNTFIHIFIGSIAVLLLGCGTINTVTRGDSVTKRDMNHVKSPCEAIPRIYSGISYDICVLRGKTSRSALWLGPGPELMFVDLALSGVFDTVFLPYTIYQQVNEGSIYLQ